jgi:5-hydroxyisourate hydrolase
MGKLSTHVLDTSRGTPASGVRVELHRLKDTSRELMAEAITNAQGRTDAPLLTGERLEPGQYELTFYIGDYFRHAGAVLSTPPFLDTVIVRVGLADAGGHYHIPLLVSPYGYSTYRGS